MNALYYRTINAWVIYENFNGSLCPVESGVFHYNLFEVSAVKTK